ncbi:MAG: patatin-like phospholipase family protein [Fulvivirga sp.]|nr:patatin-like phospholipase family protein [Fulvivirga sp.]
MQFLRFLLLAFIFLLSPFLAQSQKVAVVLSGGGAKGLAHVGVLKLLEENNIPIDYLVGTSMGGIVGGLYAAGYSVDEIEAMLLSDDFQRWVNGDFEKGYNYFYSKEEPDASFLSLKLSLDSTMHATFASSLASELTLNFELIEKFTKPAAAANYNFDSLFVPLRIMAADIFTQKAIAIDSGSLSSAVRATFSVPFFYKPIRFKGKYLFDGGIYNNFPVDVARETFSPDVIIGVNVASKVFNEYPEKRDEELITRSLLFMLLDKSDPESIPESGVYIEPDLEGYNAFDFDQVKALMDSGYSAAARQLGEINSKIERRRDQEEFQNARKPFKANGKPLLFTGIKLYGFNSKQRKFIRHVFKFKEGESITFDEVKKGYFRLVSEKYFHTIYPDITYQPDTDSYCLEIYGRPENNFNVKVGGAITTRNISQVYLGAEHFYFNNYLLKNSVNFYTGSFYKSAQWKTKLNFPALGQFYLESDLTYNHWDYLDEEDVFAPDTQPTLLVRTDRRYGLNLGFPIGGMFKAVAGGAWIDNRDDFSNLESFSSSDTLDRMDLDGYKVEIELSENTLNRKLYPNRGSAFSLKLQYFNLEERYDPGSTSPLTENQNRDHQWVRARLTMEQYFRTGRYSSGYYFQGNFSNQPFFSTYTGTLVNAPGLNVLQDSETLFLQNLKGHNYIAFGLRNVISIRDNLDFRLEGYAFKPFKIIAQTADRMATYNTELGKIYLAGTAGLVLQTPAGPIGLSFNYYDDPETQFGVLLHAGYLLFQERSMQ